MHICLLVFFGPVVGKSTLQSYDTVGFNHPLESYVGAGIAGCCGWIGRANARAGWFFQCRVASCGHVVFLLNRTSSGPVSQFYRSYSRNNFRL